MAGNRQVKFTKPVLERKPPKTGRDEWRDTESPLILVITSNNARSFSARFRIRGRKEQIRMVYPGAVDIKNLPAARAWAADIVAKAKQGVDPRPKAVPVEREPDTFKVVVERFIDMYAKRRNRSWKETERVFDTYVIPKWGKRSIAGIRRIDVTELLDDIEKASGVYTSNRTLAAVRKLFNWHQTRDDDFVSPVVPGMTRHGETMRTRTLTDDEIKKLWDAFEMMAYPWGQYFQMLLLTAQRKMEVAHAAWPQIDGDMWIIPAELNKGGRVKTVPLAPAAAKLIDEIPRFKDRDLLFTSGRKGDAVLAGFSRAKAEADRLSGVAGWRIHDLRRTGAKWLRDNRVDLATRKAVLGHSMKNAEGVTAHYHGEEDPHAFDAVKRNALEAWAAHVEHVVSGEENEKVVQLAKAR